MESRLARGVAVARKQLGPRVELTHDHLSAISGIALDGRLLPRPEWDADRAHPGTGTLAP
jgi:hypothetical protein